MKRLSVCIAFIFSSVCAFAQTGAVQGFCTQGAVPAVTSGSSSANTLQGVIAGCTVTVYLHGTTTLATIYKDANNTPLANPFTANLAGATNAGGWLFYAATSQGVDIFGSGGGGNPACTTQPKCYTVSTPLAVAVYPSTAITVVTGVLSINGAPGSFTFTGSGVNCSGTTCTFGGGNGITALTGDVTATGPGSAAATLATVNSGPGTCGDSTHVCQVTVNGKGLTTAQTQVAISGGGGGGGNIPSNAIFAFVPTSASDDDNHVLSPAVALTSWSTTGSTTTVINTGTNGFSANQWVSMRFATSFPSLSTRFHMVQGAFCGLEFDTI